MNRKAGLIVFVALCCTAFVSAQNRKPLIQKEPAWVTLTSIDYNSNQMDHEADDGYINLAYEQQVSLQQQSIYSKYAIKILSESGVQNASEVSVSFDPSYSQLIFHTIRIIRGGESINKLQLGKIKVIQQEDELNMYVYNGSLSAILILEDVRKGDIVEYSYTVKGFNPVFKGKFAGIFETSFSVPVYNLYYRLITPAGKPVQIRNSLTNINYTKTALGNETAYEWKLQNVSGVHQQDYTPGWYDPYSMVMVSEYQSWKEVNDWARELFPANISLSPGLRKKISELNTNYTTPAQRIQAALRFVQDDVRYMGIEMGPRSHKPHDPNKIFAQRFGDCKDKSYLLCILLKGMGIEASPVLINTTAKKTLANRLPAPSAFDHCTVRVFLNGRYYWFDPTISYQRGTIDAISYPDYQCGLVIHDTTTALTMIPLETKGMVDVREEFNIPDMSGNARLKVHTVYSGKYADNVRSEYNSTSKSEMKEDYRKFYASYYEKIEIDSITCTDDDSTGKFVVDEYYSIQDLWDLKNEVHKCIFSPYVINGVVNSPKDLKRTMPIGISHPAKYQEEIIINVPDDWNGKESMSEVNCAGFKMRSQFAYFYRKFKLKYEYETLKDHVTAAEAASYLSGVKKIDEELNYSLTSSELMTDKVMEESNAAKKNTGYVISLVVVLVGITIWWTQRRK